MTGINRAWPHREVPLELGTNVSSDIGPTGTQVGCVT
jgi:hypothetical protein